MSTIVNEIKGKVTPTPFEKSRLVIQAYNDEGKEAILTQSPTIQRASQRLIVALAPALAGQGIDLYLRDITQAYIQSTTTLNRVIIANLPKQMKDQYPEGTVMVVRRPLYGLPEAGTHWWSTYYKHHKDKLGMTQSTYDACLLVSTVKSKFGLVGMQTDDTLILANDLFANMENDELQKAKLTAKPRDKLTVDSKLMFNGCILTLNADGSIDLTQKNQGTKLNLVMGDNQKQAYLEQRARGAFIASICQPEAVFDLSTAAQHQDPDDTAIKLLNRRLQWQMDHMSRGLKYVSLELSDMKVFVFVDGSFANNKDFLARLDIRYASE